MATITFITTGHTAPDTSDFREATLTPKGREQTKSLRARFFEPPEDKDDRKGWKPKQFDLALIEPTAASQDMALMLLRKQVPAVPIMRLPALLPANKKTADKIITRCQQLNGMPLNYWCEDEISDIRGYDSWIYNAFKAIGKAITTTKAHHTLVIGQIIIFNHIVLKWTNDVALLLLLLNTGFFGGEGFELNVETNLVTLIKH